MTFYYETEWESEAFEGCEETLKSVCEAACEYVKCPYECSVNLLLTDDVAVRDMNREFRGIDRATDVLSFPSVDYDTPASFDTLEEHAEDYFDPETGELLLGDIVISVERAKEQAKEYGHSLKREVGFLFCHGLLHCLGYDHMKPEDEKVMFALQDEILDPILPRNSSC